MILGMTPAVFFHTLLSLVGIASGLVVVFGLLHSQRLPALTGLFLATTVLTCVTGFFLPADKLLPSHITGIVALVVLAIALFALYARRLAGIWRGVYAATATLALYLNVFVLVVQLFLKVPALHALAPTQQEAPFAVAQGVVFVVFAVVGVLATRRFHPFAAPRAIISRL